MKVRIKRVMSGLAVLVLLGGCAAGGVSHLGKVSLSDGSTVETVASKSKGDVGARITRVDVFRCREQCEHIGSNSAASDGLVDRAVSGVVPAAVLGGSAIGAARMLQPARTVIQTQADALSLGGSGGNATSVSAPSSGVDLGITINK